DRSYVCQSSSQRVQALHKQNLHHGGPRKCRSRHQPSADHLSSTLHLEVDEIKNALKLWIKIVQGQFFKSELARMYAKKVIRRGPLRKLNARLDEEGIIRLGGRIGNANVPFAQKFPIVLPGDSHLSSLLVANAHKLTLHGNVQAMLNNLRQQYWILGAR